MSKSNQNMSLVVLSNKKATKKDKLSKKKREISKNSNFSIKKLKEEPVSYAFKTKNSAPKFRLSKGKNVIISHTEYLLDIITASSGYHVAKLSINPGLSMAFPWLSRIAPNFEAFRLRKVSFMYKPASSTVVNGTIMMVSDPNPTNSAPESKTDFLSLKGATTTNVYKLLVFNPLIKDVNLEKSYYVRSESPGVNQDIRLYDPCNFYIGYWGVQNNATIGEIHISYEVEFINPTLYLSKQLLEQVETCSFNSLTGISQNYPLGDNFLSRLIGKFQSVGLSYKKGSTAGHIFSSTKSISKVISSVMNLASSFTSGTLPGLLFKVASLILTSSSSTLNTFEKNDIIMWEDSDIDVLQQYDDDPSKFEDISNDNSSVQTHVVSHDGNQVVQTYTFRMKAGDILEVKWEPGTSNKVPSAVYSYRMTDNIFGADPY